MTQNDGIGHYKGNYGNLLFLWDVLFGTARITRRYPARCGLYDDVVYGPEKWTAQLFYPLFRSKREQLVLTGESASQVAAATLDPGPEELKAPAPGRAGRSRNVLKPEVWRHCDSGLHEPMPSVIGASLRATCFGPKVPTGHEPAGCA